MPALAHTAAYPEVGVEPLEGLRAELDEAAQRDVAVHKRAVGGLGALLNPVSRQPLVEQVAETRARLGRLPLLDLATERVRSSIAASSSSRRAGQHHGPSGDRVGTGRDPDLEAAAALADAGQGLRRSLPARHVRQHNQQRWTANWTKAY